MEGIPGASAEATSSLREYVDVLRRRKWIVVLAAVIVPVAALALSLRQDALYRADAEVLSRPNQAANLSGAADPTLGQSPERMLQTQADTAAVPKVAGRVLRAAGVTNRTPEDFLAQSAVTAKTTSNLLVFSVWDHDRALAAELATGYARQFIGFARELETTSLKRARAEVVARIAQLEANDQTATDLYARLVEREQQLGTLTTLITSNTVLVREASKAVQVKPQPFRNFMMGVFLGLFVGICAAFLLEALDTRVRSTSEIERRLGLPLLARLPEPPRWIQRRRDLVMLASPNSMEAETYRVLRTNIEFFNMEHGARTIMITSAVASEGKSTTAANLAVALSRAGRRVILVDLDLRRPSLDKFFDFEGRVGLTDVVLGRAKLGEMDDDAPGEGRLEVLTTGPLPANAGEFIGASALSDLLAELRERADIVIVDSPPLLAVADTMALASKVDALVVLTRLNVVRRSTLEELRRVLSACRAAKLGFVVTGAQTEPEYKYGYGYGYGYGYAQAATKERR